MPSQVNPESISPYEIEAGALRRQLAIIRDELNELRVKTGIDAPVDAEPVPQEAPPPAQQQTQHADAHHAGHGRNRVQGGAA